MPSDQWDTAVVDRVILVNASDNGQAFTLAVLLEDGRQLSLGIASEEAVKIVEGLTRTTRAGALSRRTLRIAHAVDISVDVFGRALLLMGRGADGTELDALAIPLDLAEQIAAHLPAKIAEARALVGQEPQA
jgi:hypothetical protein